MDTNQKPAAGDPMATRIAEEQAQRDNARSASNYDTRTKRYTVRNVSPGARYFHHSDASAGRSVPKHLRPGESFTADFNEGEYNSLMTRAGDLEIRAGDSGGAVVAHAAGANVKDDGKTADQLSGATAVQVIDFDKATAEELRAYIDIAGGPAPGKKATIEELRDAARQAKADYDAKAKQ